MENKFQRTWMSCVGAISVSTLKESAPDYSETRRLTKANSWRIAENLERCNQLLPYCNGKRTPHPRVYGAQTCLDAEMRKDFNVRFDNANPR